VLFLRERRHVFGDVEVPDQHDAMEAAFLRSARLGYRFWEMAYTLEGWELPGER